MPENFLDVIHNEYYFPSSTQPGLKTERINGYYDAVKMLYSDELMNEYPSTSEDYYNITVTTAGASRAGMKNFTQEIKMILPQGMKPLMSEEAGDVATLCMATNGDYCSYKYRSLIRGFITKLPGTGFSGFKELVMFNPIAVVSEPQYAEMMQDMQEYYLNSSDTFVNNWQDFVGNSSYDW